MPTPVLYAKVLLMWKMGHFYFQALTRVKMRPSNRSVKASPRRTSPRRELLGGNLDNAYTRCWFYPHSKQLYNLWVIKSVLSTIRQTLSKTSYIIFKKKWLLASGTTLILSNPSSKSLIQEGNERLRGSPLTLLEHFLKMAIGGRISQVSMRPISQLNATSYVS